MSNIYPTYKQFIIELKQKVRSAQAEAAVAVNSELIVLYWDLGKMITEKQTAYGTGFLTQLSKDLTTEFPDMKGFSRRNLSSMGQFYQFYAPLNWQQPVAKLENIPDTSNLQQPVANLENINNDPQNENRLSTQNEIRHQAVAQIPWGHNISWFDKLRSVESAQNYFQVLPVISKNNSLLKTIKE